ncbi:MAG: 2Fe-2S iron-sulfur cluster-binding protein [Pseudomonadales bacterium]|nr:2Fe-2S iron-sulfur cluster-binding protein [Pseudomonadales bacterium]MDP6471226.1 2Fe-2S iron-sulfur cluster-binding protein [Pseudomonadales bacterium]MDP6825585.1 2Fe-2S iron-sulfur cluster-binding protein [Pseudomonadales bacterium]MDP6972952.1 2Fe-2S iron-sulfur cluster-binding protein [Pseudomonadales bacterium]
MSWARAGSFELSADGENLLDAGINHGLDLPHSCKGGVCSSCKARLRKGALDMDITHGLETEEIDAGFVLTCQSHPISEAVVIDFDER